MFIKPMSIYEVINGQIKVCNDSEAKLLDIRNEVLYCRTFLGSDYPNNIATNITKNCTNMK